VRERTRLDVEGGGTHPFIEKANIELQRTNVDSNGRDVGIYVMLSVSDLMECEWRKTVIANPLSSFFFKPNARKEAHRPWPIDGSGIVQAKPWAHWGLSAKWGKVRS